MKTKFHLNTPLPPGFELEINDCMQNHLRLILLLAKKFFVRNNAGFLKICACLRDQQRYTVLTSIKLVATQATTLLRGFSRLNLLTLSIKRPYLKCAKMGTKNSCDPNQRLLAYLQLASNSGYEL